MKWDLKLEPLQVNTILEALDIAFDEVAAQGNEDLTERICNVQGVLAEQLKAQVDVQ